MSRFAPLVLALVVLLAVQPALLARPARQATRTSSGMPSRHFAMVVKSLKDDPELIEEILGSDKQFKELAERFIPASRSRLSGGRALIAFGAIFIILGSIIGSAIYVGDPGLRDVAVGTLAGGIGGGFALFIPGVAIAASNSSAENEMIRYWQENKESFLRPEALTGPRFRLAAGRAEPASRFLPSLSFSF
jgi:hypothetical protein